MLGVRILTPRTGRIGVRSIVSSGIATGVTRRGASMLGAAIIAPISIAHAVAGVFVIRIAAVPAIGFAPVLRCRILLPASIGIAVTGCIDGFALALAAIAAIFPIAVSRTRCILLIIQNPSMAAAGGTSPRTVGTGTMIFIHISP